MSQQQTSGICLTTLARPVFEKVAAFELYPKPYKGVVTIQYNLDVNNAQLKIFDAVGGNPSSHVLLRSEAEIQIDTSRYGSGMYMGEIRKDGLVT